MIAGRRTPGVADVTRGERVFEARRLAALHRLAMSLTGATTPEEAAGHVSAALPEIVACDVLQVCLLEDDGLVLRAVFPADLPWAVLGTRIPNDETLPWLAIRRRETCLHNGISHPTSGGEEARWPVGPTIQSVLSAPLMVQRTVVGTLNLLSTRRAPYSAGAAAWVQALADQLAGCLENLRLRRELREANLDWEQTFTSVEDLLTVIDRDGRVLRVNHGYGGRSVEEMVGRDGSEVFAFCAGGEGAFPLERVLRRRGEIFAERTAPDREHALSISSHPVRGQDGQVARVLVCARDVTASRRMESQLFQSAKLAAIGEMAAGVAHELNSPLTAVLGNANLLLRRTAPDDKAYRMLSDIKTCGHRCKKIITNMLTFARQDRYVLEPLRLNDVVASAIDLIGYQLSKSGIEVERHLDPGLPAVLGNSQQIEQVLVNLLLNARDAMEGREPKAITVTTGFSELDGGQFGAAITVSDTGAGIPLRHREKIFDPFFTTKEATKGTGLGLSVSMGIARAHGGTLTVESRPGAGSTFALVLPFPEQRLSEGGGEGPARVAAALPAETLEKLRPSLELARKLGRLHAQLGTTGLTTVEIVGAAGPAAWGTGVLTAAALVGLLFPPSEEDAPDLASARRVARERGVRVLEAVPAAGEETAFSVRVKVETSQGTCTLSGALFGIRDPRLVEIDGFRIEATLQGHLLIFWAHDRPGLVGSIASLLGAHGIGIRQMRSASEADAGDALAVFHVDNSVGDEVLSELRQLPSLVRVARATL